MIAFTDSKIREVYSDFIANAARVRRLCACKKLTYERGKSPDYSIPLVQQYYMLRYFPAYLAEYYLMYREMLAHRFLPPQLNVLSIGCGCGVDFWGLMFAIRDSSQPERYEVSYQGIDINDWKYRDNMGMSSVKFTVEDISDYEELDRTDYNVIVFPKCIGEFSESVISSICKMLSNSFFLEDRICILCSKMDKMCSVDDARLQRVSQVMERSGFQCIDVINSDFGKGLPLWDHCEFHYPEDILPCAEKVINFCPTFRSNQRPCDEKCIESLVRSPILKDSFVKYTTLLYERE